jgi:hypothetical protein
VPETSPIPLPKDWREFIALLNSNRVDYVVVGAFALAFHGHPRYTGDLDLLVRPSLENAERMEKVVATFHFASLGLTASDFTEPGQIVQLGRPPNRIDLLTSLTGVDFDEVWATRISSSLEGLPVSFISRECLIRNKKATARAQDLADVEALGGA